MPKNEYAMLQAETIKHHFLKLLLTSLVAACLGILFFGATVSAATSTTQTKTVSYDNTQCKVPGSSFSFPCPLGGGANKLPEIFGRVIKWTMGLVGALFFAMFVYGGFQYIIAGSNSKSAEAGQKTLINATIGLAIIIGSYMLVSLLVDTFNAGLGINKPTEPTTQEQQTSSTTQSTSESGKCIGNCLSSCGKQAEWSGTCPSGLKCCSDNPY